ncbi:discoidin domain-containing receptor tyrosine kinase B-like, partial [Nilaparvata lugens]|uniref:discoidin domain-containing receptor tyrosine kinase B-like n=1 Tax=Nilaparvata lugens TaxID=108931 RepID=UPI00193D0DEF
TLAGNTNTYLVEEQKLDPVLLASKVRFVPYSVHVRTVCMRVEILGCPWKGGLISYSMPQGLVRGDVDLRDALYDGREEGMRLMGGLGNLVDGHKGNDNFHVEVYGPGK